MLDVATPTVAAVARHQETTSRTSWTNEETIQPKPLLSGDAASGFSDTAAPSPMIHSPTLAGLLPEAYIDDLNRQRHELHHKSLVDQLTEHEQREFRYAQWTLEQARNHQMRSTLAAMEMRAAALKELGAQVDSVVRALKPKSKSKSRR